MKHAHMASDDNPFSEMAIVETFTKLIFGEESQYSNRELLIIQAFRMVDAYVVFDSHRDMGEYLRVLGVREMIQLVTRVQQQLAKELPVLPDAVIGGVRSSAVDRRAH